MPNYLFEITDMISDNMVSFNDIVGIYSIYFTVSYLTFSEELISYVGQCGKYTIYINTSRNETINNAQ